MRPGDFTELRRRYEAADELKQTAEQLERLADDVEHSDGFILRAINPNRRGEVFDFNRLPGFATALKVFLDEQYSQAKHAFEEF